MNSLTALQNFNFTEVGPLVKIALLMAAITALRILVRRSPAKLVKWFIGFMTTTIISERALGTPGGFHQFAMVFCAEHERPGVNNKRRFLLVNGKIKEKSASPTSWFIHDGLLVLKEVSNNRSGDVNVEKLELTVFTRNEEKIQKLVSVICPTDPNKRQYYNLFPTTGRNSDTPWEAVKEIAPSSHLFLDPAIKEKLDKQLDRFLNDEQWYVKHDFPRKLTVLLYGVPGTGKTSIARYIADYLNASIYIAKLGDFGARMAVCVAKVPVGQVLLLEDFDTGGQLGRRGKPVDGDDEAARNSATFAHYLNDFLNVFQGIIPLGGQVTVLTTNHPEHVDPAVMRTGRIDLLVEVGPLPVEQVAEYVKHYYGVVVDSRGFTPVLASDLANAHSLYPEDAGGMCAHLGLPYMPL